MGSFIWNFLSDVVLSVTTKIIDLVFDTPVIGTKIPALNSSTEQNVAVPYSEKIRNGFRSFISGPSFGPIIPDDVYTELHDLCKTLPPLESNLSYKTKNSYNEVIFDSRRLVDYTKSYDITDLARFLDTEYILFNSNGIRESQATQSIKLTVARKNQDRLCLLCNKSFPDQLYHVYTHLQNQQHKQALSLIKEDPHLQKKCSICNKKLNIFCDTYLMRKCMKRLPNDDIECYLCKFTVKNNDVLVHLSERTHKQNEIMWKEASTQFAKYIASEAFNYFWYSFQWFSCTICNTMFDVRIDFLQHIVSKNHLICMRNGFKFDFCIPCTTAWFGKENIYEKHCQHKVHTRLCQYNDFDSGSVPVLAKSYLKDLNSIQDRADKLYAASNMACLKRDLDLKYSLLSIVRGKYPFAKVYVFGSRITGLAQPNSDVDIYIEYENVRPRKLPCHYFHEVLPCIESNSKKHETSWNLLDVVKTKLPQLKLRYQPTGLKCNISFYSGTSIENSRLIRAFTEAYLPCRKLILFLKDWVSLCNLSGDEGIKSYALVWYTIFYLQNLSILPSVHRVINEATKNQLREDWTMGMMYNIHIDPVHESRTFQDLLYGFFKYYGHYDFRNMVLCPLLGQSIPKTNFMSQKSLPKAMFDHKSSSSICLKLAYFTTYSGMCIQDPLDLSENITKDVSILTLRCFKDYCFESAQLIFPKSDLQSS